MKRKVLATILGAAGLLGLAGSSFGQGQIHFSNYTASPYFPVIYTGPLAGTLAGSDVTAELGYFLGTSTDTSLFTLIPSSITSVNAATPGYFQGGVALIPGYASGPVSFEIIVKNGDNSYNNLNLQGFSTYVWTEPSLATVPSPSGEFTALPGNILLNPVPEPTTLALAGLGGLASLVAFRRKQS